MKKFYLIDVSAMFFRAYYAIRPLTSPSGLPVNAIYGFLSMMAKLMKDEKPEYVVFCYDRKEPSFRKELYDGYKANRTEMPEDLAKQIPYIKQIPDLLGIPALEVPDYEADDIIGTIVKKRHQWNAQMVIVSGDKDFSQLVEEGVILYDTMKDLRLDAKGVKEKWGVTPEQFIDFLAIVGDSSDNVPGVKGIGEKGAIKLLEQFHSLENIYQNLEQIESKSIKQKLIDAKEMAFLSKQLVTIVTDVPISENIQDYHLKEAKAEELRAFLKELNFKTFEKTFLGDGTVAGVMPSAGGAKGATSAIETTSLQIKVTTSPLEVAPTSLKQEDPSSLVSAPTSLREDYQVEELTLQQAEGVFVSGQELWGLLTKQGLVVAVSDKIYQLVGDLKNWGLLFSNKKIQWKGYDLKSFFHELKMFDGQVVWDGMLAAYVLKARDVSEFEKVYQQVMSEALPELPSLSQVYSAHLGFEQQIRTNLREIHGEKVLMEFDQPLVSILCKMESRGIALDVPLLAEQSRKLGDDLKTLEKKIHDLAGEVFNIASPKQLGVILFEKLGLATGKKTKTGYSTDNEVLQSLDHPLAPLVLEYRELAKLKSTYVDALPTLVHEDGRIHTHFNQALTTTGRLSSTNPNLQNIPIRTLRGQEVRKAFVAAPGKALLSADYSQIELRVLAHISEDVNLCKAFAEDLDIHAATAAEIYGVSLSEVTPDLRRAAKAVNFGIAYGQGAFGLAENLGIGRGEAKDIIDRYFKRFQGVQEYIESTIKRAHENGYVETLFGRRRYIDELQAKNVALKKFGERAAINAPIQGTAADLVKLAMIKLDEKIKIPMLLQVHDELIFEASQAELEAASLEILKIMEGVASLKVPLKVNYAIGANWDEAH